MIDATIGYANGSPNSDIAFGLDQLGVSSNWSAVYVGVGIGIPGASTSTCSLSRSLDATAGSTPQIAIPVDPGTYCAEVYDAGSLTAPGVSFSLTIAHP